MIIDNCFFLYLTEIFGVFFKNPSPFFFPPRQPAPDNSSARLHQGAGCQRQRSRVCHVLRYIRLRERQSRTGARQNIKKKRALR